ncbi:snRNA-activating protein complex subunit isoform X2 [Ricinus communis]|uniref:snRNA-activating protein complex subunit isoform X2 n=1 Tax=Ricinus communis TaxID=3988 RepID=UPI0007722140|nr:snRNA-activating protein complex subunit isoform X2 [Ricinus communis]|eukprot:XP_015578460.1 snRNA-activating protein complex subunit isoform X2 [Ricinus communis]
MIEEEEQQQQEEESKGIARGGPIFVPNLVGPLTSVPDFESALLHELQDLKDQLSSESSPSSPPNIHHHLDISVDEIKLLCDEDLVDMALNDTPFTESNGSCLRSSNASENDNLKVSSNNNLHLERSGRGRDSSPPTTGTIVNRKARKRKLSPKPSDGSHAPNTCNGATSRKIAKKRKGRQTNKHVIDENCLAKVSELLKLKEKQLQEKAASGLYALNCKISKSVNPSLEKTESMKYLKSTYFEKQSKPQYVQEHIALQHPEFVLCIEVYHNIRNWIKTQEFLVLGRQMLTELRDKIYCMTDQVMEKAGQHDPSGYFLVEDVFCNDLRDSSAIDYSEPIFDWLSNSKDDALRKWECITGGELRRKQKAVLGELPSSCLPQFRRVDMQKTRFCDLRFRLGAGYLYCHQGDCKHTIVIRDMRLIHPEDVQNRAAYPVVIFQLKPRVRKCNVCGIFRAKKVTVDDKWTPHSPCYFCNDCYYLLHYENGSLLYSDFSTYDYLQDLPA